MNGFKQFLVGGFFVISGAAFAGPVNVNTADAKTIDKELDGVGTAIAAAIVEERAKGPFKDAADFQKRVSGVGPKLIEKNKANLKFSDK